MLGRKLARPCVAPLALGSSRSSVVLPAVLPTRRPESHPTRAVPQSAQGGETADSSVLEALKLLTGEIRALSSKVGTIDEKVDKVDEIRALSSKVGTIDEKVDKVDEKVGTVAAGLGDVRRFQGTIVEMVTLMNLPARLKGCRRVRFEVDADLDAVFGRGTAAAVLGAVAHPSGGRMLRTRLLRRLLLAVRQDLDDGISLPVQSSGKGAAAVKAVLDTLPPVPAGQDRHREGTQQQQQQQQQQQEPQEPPSAVADAETRLAAFKAQLSQAARKQSPDIPGVRLVVSRAQQLLKAAGVLGDKAPARWNAAFGLLQRLSSSSSSGQGGGGSSGGGQSRRGTAAGRSPSSQALLVLFLLATGRLRAELEVDLMRLRPRIVGTPLFGRPELLVGEIKSDLSELGPARRQLEIALAVLELACRFSPYYGGGGVLRSLLAPYSRWRPPSLDARAVVCGVLDGKALAARQGLLGDLQVQLVADLDLDPDLGRVLGPVAAVAAAARGEAGQAAAAAAAAAGGGPELAAGGPPADSGGGKAHAQGEVEAQSEDKAAAVAAAARGEAGQAAAAAAGGGPELAAGGPPADSGVGKAHAQGEVEAQSEDKAAAVMMHVPLEVLWFDGSGTLTLVVEDEWASD